MTNERPWTTGFEPPNLAPTEEACTNLALSYRRGLAGSVDEERAQLFARIGALRGCIIARHRCGRDEYYSGNVEVGIRHWKIAAEAGNQLSLNRLRDIYNANGKMPGKEFISKEYLDKAFRTCHEAQDEIQSDERERHCKLIGQSRQMKC